MNLEQIRKQIDKIDDDILNLLLERMECSRLIAKIKYEKNISIFDKIDDIKLKSEDNYKYVFPIFLEILNSSKTLQKEITKNSK